MWYGINYQNIITHVLCDINSQVNCRYYSSIEIYYCKRIVLQKKIKHSSLISADTAQCTKVLYCKYLAMSDFLEFLYTNLTPQNVGLATVQFSFHKKPMCVMSPFNQACPEHLSFNDT